MSKLKIIAAYVLLGPMIGGIIMFILMLMLTSSGSHSLISLYSLISLLADCAALLALSYPMGFLAAFAAGITHAMLEGKIQIRHLVLLVPVAGILGHLLTVYFLGNLDSVFSSMAYFAGFVITPLLSAIIVFYAITQWRKRTRPAVLRDTD